MDEATLIAAARQGSNDAFTELYRRHLRYVKAVGHSILHTGDLDDLCQETFLLAFTRLDRFRGGSTFRTWITRIAMNQCFMQLRRNSQATNGSCNLLAIDSQMASDDLLEECLMVSEDSQLRAATARFDLAKLLRGLTTTNRRILEMAYLEELPDREIAERTGFSLAAVKGRLYQAKCKARSFAR